MKVRSTRQERQGTDSRTLQRAKAKVSDFPGTLHVMLSLGTTREELKELMRAERVCKESGPCSAGAWGDPGAWADQCNIPLKS